MKPGTCEHCGAPVVRSKVATYNPPGSDKQFHVQTCTNRPKISNTETVESVRRALRL